MIEAMYVTLAKLTEFFTFFCILEEFGSCVTYEDGIPKEDR